EAGHERGLANRAAQVAAAAPAGHRVLSHENLRTLAVIFIEMGCVAHEPFGRVVKMFVYNVRAGCTRIATLPMVGHEFDVGVLGVDSFHEQWPALAINLAPVFVADFQVFEIEGSGMTSLGAHRP